MFIRKRNRVSRRLFTDFTEREVSISPRTTARIAEIKSSAPNLHLAVYNGMKERNTPGPLLVAKQVTATNLFVISSRQFVS